MMDYVLPVSISGAFVGALAYLYLVQKIYDIFSDAYPALVDNEAHHYRVNLDQPLQAFFKVPPLLKSGEWRQVPSLLHRRLCLWTFRLSRLVLLCLAGFLAAFFI
ncbi:hypothetical protein IGB42_03653 [Andreprevotia sp. IGB-42]|uniref:hypothetical protein n=1 Tax=Andreprevotia sp. IGB-42 TaxID=2497473 RepID=UPI00135C94D4|nr:hypothetical protein [Andreprevotia sp. IGB-42]KAF0811843.1 hypothetical protein IGB42_03653 [Andreprevotia sp. IGB-42]